MLEYGRCHHQVAAAIVAVIGGDECPTVVSRVQIVLCIVGPSAVYYGFKIFGVLRESIHPMVVVEVDVRTIQAQYGGHGITLTLRTLFGAGEVLVDMSSLSNVSRNVVKFDSITHAAGL